MNRLNFKNLCYIALFSFVACFSLFANQTPTISPILSGEVLPFSINIRIAKDNNGEPFLLPRGLQAFVFGNYHGKSVLLAGRTNGLHGFNGNDPITNFPPNRQNRDVCVIDLDKRTSTIRSLADSNLTTEQIESLSVTSPQFYQKGCTLYISGGYGFDSSINNYITFDKLTAINIPCLIKWVESPQSNKFPITPTIIRQISDPIFRITGGEMFQLCQKAPTQIVFGQEFDGTYMSGNVKQVYSEQVRRFHICDDGRNLSFQALDPQPSERDPNYRRRDLNVVPAIKRGANGKVCPYLIALSGVFTPPPDDGIWTVPVTVSACGFPSMADPNNPLTFKQGMNNYASARMGCYSEKNNEMFTTIFGGLTYAYFDNGILKNDNEIPFTNQVTTIKVDSNNVFSQYIMDAEYPVIPSTDVNPGNPLLFGTGAEFIHANGTEHLFYPNGVFRLDCIKKPTLIGYIVGGIQSTLPNTNSEVDSSASRYIFEVWITPKSRCCCK